MESRLDIRFSTAGASSLVNELKCHLPLSLIAMKAVTSRAWPEIVDPSNKSRLALRTLLAALLPPNTQKLPFRRVSARVVQF
jgi:hypothetical protein